MARMVLILTLLARAGARRGERGLLEALRRRLMEDNYQYMESSDSAELTRAPPLLHDYAGGDTLAAAGARARDRAHAHAHQDPHYSEYARRARRPQRRRADSDVPDAIDDGLQQIDRGPDLPEPESDPGPRDQAYSELVAGAVDDPGPQDARPKYTYLKIPGPSGRRSGGGARRFLQEERPDGVAILSLAGAPFPEFRLPSDRRQYMGEHLPSENDVEGEETRRHRAPVPPLPRDEPDSSRPLPNPLDEDLLYSSQ